MVPSCRVLEHPDTVRFDGGDNNDANKFMFMFKNDLTLAKEDEDREIAFMCHFEGAALDFYYETFARDGSVTCEAKCYKFVKRAFIYRFRPTQEL